MNTQPQTSPLNIIPPGMSLTCFILTTQPVPLTCPKPPARPKRENRSTFTRPPGMTADQAIDAAIKAEGRPMTQTELQHAIGQVDLFKRLTNRVRAGTLLKAKVATVGARNGCKTHYYALPAMKKQLENMG